MPSSAKARTLTARMRQVSGDSQRRRPMRGSARLSAGSGRREAAEGALPLPVAVAISDAIQRLDLREVVVDDLELLAQPLDVAVDGAVVDIDVLAVGGVHQLVAALDVAGAQRERLQDQELGDGQLDRGALPGAQVARRV